MLCVWFSSSSPFSFLCCLSSLLSSCLSSWPSTSSSTMWWTISLSTSANEDLGTLAEYDPLTKPKNKKIKKKKKKKGPKGYSASQLQKMLFSRLQHPLQLSNIPCTWSVDAYRWAQWVAWFSEPTTWKWTHVVLSGYSWKHVLTAKSDLHCELLFHHDLIGSAWISERCRTSRHRLLNVFQHLRTHWHLYLLSDFITHSSCRQGRNHRPFDKEHTLFVQLCVAAFRLGLVKKEQCSSICKKITPVLLLSETAKRQNWFLNCTRVEKHSNCSSFWKFEFHQSSSVVLESCSTCCVD